jgi:hypothetical protein
MLRALFTAASLLALSAAASADTTLLSGGHVIDAERGTDEDDRERAARRERAY